MKSSLFALILIFQGFILTCVALNEADKINPTCECIKNDCGCCIKLNPVLDGNLCTNFSYLPDQYGISVTITYNGIDVFNETISAKNPPPICVIHIAELQMEICLHFYDMDVVNKCFSGCLEFELSFFKIIPLKKIKLGCFKCKTVQQLNTEIQHLINDSDVINYNTNNNEVHPTVILI